MTPAKLELLASLKQFEDDLKEAVAKVRALRLDIQIEKPDKDGASPSWDDFKRRERVKGQCVCCDRKLRGNQRLLCAAAECDRLFRAIYARGYRATKQGAA